MVRSSSEFICQQCGAVHSKWSGQCGDCGAWDTLVEEAVQAVPKGLKPLRSGSGKAGRIEFQQLEGDSPEAPRITTGIGELDRVLGGGLVPGSATLIGGDPGIGKSTILLQLVDALARKGEACAYISGEESVAQIRLRAKRLGLTAPGMGLASATSVRDIVASLKGSDAPRVVVIDSIQTMYLDSIESAPGTVAQVRASSNELIRLAKQKDIAVLLVGHVTKEGQIAGPRVLEHMVDTVLYFEGERGHQFRILRGVKNRFGGTDEIGVFAMTDKGLQEVTNPSALFITQRDHPVSGTAVFAGMEGSRPLLVEVQALVAPSPIPTPRRAVVGWDSARLAMILAVLQTRCGIVLHDKEIYLSVAGGLRVQEPAADLAVAAALLSSLTDTPVPEGSVWFGEVGLSGEIRAVGRSDARLKEAAKLGFTQVFYPKTTGASEKGLKSTALSHIQELALRFAKQGRAA